MGVKYFKRVDPLISKNNSLGRTNSNRVLPRTELKQASIMQDTMASGQNFREYQESQLRSQQTIDFKRERIDRSIESPEKTMSIWTNNPIDLSNS